MTQKKDNYNGNELHYIVSGTAFMYINTLKRGVDDETIDWANKHFREMQRPNNKFGMLFNAFTEKSFCHFLHENFNDSVCDIHADSGGLQMVTIGKVATYEDKKKVYETQAKYSSIAMSFDEIPVQLLDVPAKVPVSGGAYVGKRFDRSLLKERAAESGKNLREQLEYFDSIGTDAKPLLIAQGNDQDTFNEWVEIIQQQIPQHLLNNLGGVAISTATLGRGALENFESSYAPIDMPLKFDCKQIHYLGLGAFNRMAPLLALIKNGQFSNKVISYDSTTHTRTLINGRCYGKLPTGQYGYYRFHPTAYDPAIYEILIEKFNKYDLGFDDPKTLHYYLTNNSYAALEKKGDDKLYMIPKTKVAHFRYSYDNFIDQIEEYMESPNFAYGVSDDLAAATAAFAEIRNRADYDSWMRHFKGGIASVRVGKKLQTLEEFFV